MKIIAKLNPRNLKLSPKRLFRSKKDRSDVSRSDPMSFGSGTTSSSSSSEISSTNHKRKVGSERDIIGTPTSVLPDVSGDWSDVSSDIYADIYFALAQAFKLIDRDNDGVVSRNELEEILCRLGPEPPSREEVTLLLSEVDQDGEGYISMEALMSRAGGSTSACDPVGEPELRETFDFFDTDHDGKITAEELFHVFSALGDEGCTLDDCRRMIADVDRNEDGFVCFEDFSRMMELQR